MTIETFEGTGWRAVPLDEEHADPLGQLYERCADYFKLVIGAPPGPAEVQSAFTSLPEGKAYEDKHALALLDDGGTLFGHLELIRDYPVAEEWWIGLLLLAPSGRSRGLGSEIERACVEWLRRRDGRAVQLAVVEENKPALRFWRRLGYEEIERKGPRRIGTKEHRLVVLRKEL